MADLREPKITVNGRELTEPQARTFRMALQVFVIDCSMLAPASLKELYLAAGREIIQMIDEGEA